MAMRLKHHVSPFPLLFFWCKCTAATLSATQISPDEFELVLTNDFPLEISQAQNSIFQSALQVCQGKSPVFGKYSFESSEPIDSKNDAESYVFIQQITCTNEISSRPIRRPFEITAEREGELKEKASELTIEFLSAKHSGQFDVAYQMLAQQMQEMSPLSKWEKSQSGSYSQLDTVKEHDIWRLTLYNNPEDSQESGVYIAADYESTYADASISCGYIIWYLKEPNATLYQVMREEYGIIGIDIIEGVSPEELQSVRAKFGCKAI